MTFHKKNYYALGTLALVLSLGVTSVAYAVNTTTITPKGTPIHEVPLGRATSTEAKIKVEARLDGQVRTTNASSTANASTTKRILEEKMRAEKEAMQKKMTENMAEKIDRMKAQREQQLKKELDKMTERFGATIERLTGLVSRVESRISKVKAEGGTASTSEAFIVKAKLDLTAAGNALTLLKAGIATTTVDVTASSTSPTKEAVKNLKRATDAITKNLKSAQGNIERAVSALKPGQAKKVEVRAGASVEATTTAN